MIQNTLSLFVTICFLLLTSSYVNADEIYFIDAHSQVDHKVEDLNLVIQRMNEAGVYRTILATRSKRPPSDVVQFAQDYPERIVPAVRTKSGAYNNNHPKYYKKLSKQLNSHQFNAIAEVLIYHAQKGDKAPEVIVHPQDKRVQTALDAAIDMGWPFIIHIEFSSLSGSNKQQFMKEMETLLKTHPDHPFALIHMGQLDARAVRKLITTHPNLYFLTAHTNPVIVRHSNQPWINMFDGEKLTSEWKTLITQYPDRFVFALDNVWERHWQEYYLVQMGFWRKAVADLPPDVAHKFAHGNAERLWKLTPK